MINQAVFMERPAGITAIAAILFLCAADLCLIGIFMPFYPDAVSSWGGFLVQSFDRAGAFGVLRAGAAFVLIGWGLFRLQNWARWVAMLGAAWGIVILVPGVSAASIHFTLFLFWGGLQIAIRSAIVWYLLQAPVAEAFSSHAGAV
jgi:uncharacterized membrane protein